MNMGKNSDSKTTQIKDPRAYFAAERTLLAWVRTGISLMGLGFVVARFGLFLRELLAHNSGTPEHSSQISRWLGVVLILFGVFVTFASGRRFSRIAACLINEEPISVTKTSLGEVVSWVLTFIGMGMVAYLLLLRN